ncbi:superoxide dismutase [Asticcacaulis sp. W401b]|uniref:superoxide dismutase n=1 Tax=Asticcacaulis sp. W401b TaxID=3388666 RepID=UPI00397106B5
MTNLPETTRRSLLGGAVTLAGGTAAALASAQTPVPSAAKSDAMPIAPSFRAPAAPKLLPFNAAKLDGISEKLIQSHWENNYSGALKALGVVKARLNDMVTAKDVPPYIYNDLKREHLVRTGSVVLHELYFDNLGASAPGTGIRSAIGTAFGTFDIWETEFRAMGAGLGGGSGWVMLGLNLHTGQMENYWMADHAHAPAATLPLLVMDMYEHAYQMDYGAAAARYVDAFFKNINWEVVSQRYARAFNFDRLATP